MQGLFLDSSAIYAFVDRNDEMGPRIEQCLKEKKYPLVTTNLVFAESLSLITKRLGKKVGIKTGELLQDSQFLSLLHLDEKILQEGWALYKKYMDKDFDFIDATSFVFCQKNGIKEAITLDQHFAQMGFKVFP